MVNQIMSTDLLLYIKAVRHKITKFGNITPKEFLDYLAATYGEIIADNMIRNQLRVMARQMSPPPIEEMFDQLREAQIFAVGRAILQEIVDDILIRSAYNNVKATCILTLPYYTWNRITSVDQSFVTIQVYFAKVDTDRQGEDIVADMGYGTENYVDCHGNEVGTRMTVCMEMQALIEDIT